MPRFLTAATPAGKHPPKSFIHRFQKQIRPTCGTTYPHYDTEYITHITQQYGQNGQDRQSTPSDGIEDAFNFTQASGQEGGTSSGSGIGSAIAEVLLQPHVVPSSGGGGGSCSKDDDDDDKEKNKNKYYTPRKRKR